MVGRARPPAGALRAALLAALLVGGGALPASALTLSGRVVDSQEQRSYGGATVSAGPGLAAVCDDKGFFRIEGVTPGARLLAVTLPDGAGFRVRLRLPARQAAFIELDRSRHAPPAEGDEY